MKRWPLGRRGSIVASALLWGIGLASIWAIHPPAPRDGWQVPADEIPCGFLGDGVTLVTTPRIAPGPQMAGTKESGPIRLRDIRTGELRASHLGPKDVFDRVFILGNPDRLQVYQAGDGPGEFRLWLFDAWSGRELASFSPRVPRLNPWWAVSDDGKTTAFVTYEGDEPRVEVHEVEPPRLVRSIAGVREVIVLSTDGRRLAGRKGNATVVYEVESGREFASLTSTRGPSNRPPFPKMFSPDGRLLLDSACEVWDLEAGVSRLHVPGVGMKALLGPGGRELVVIRGSSTEAWLEFHDLATGRQDPNRRVRLVSGGTPNMFVTPGTPDGRLLMAFGSPRFPNPSAFQAWLAKVPGFARFARPVPVDAYVLVEAASGRVASRGGTAAFRCTPDGQSILTRSREGDFEFWDVPPRKSWRAMAPWLLGWTLAMGPVVWRSARRPGAISGSPAA